MKVEICIPSHNEEDIIASTVRDLLKEFSVRKDVDWLITVSDNGSTDNTLAVVRDLKNDRVKVFSASTKGKGLAIREALLDSSADVFGFVDADLSTHPSSILDLLVKIEEGREIVVGSRLKDESTTKRGYVRSLFSKTFRRLANLFLDMPEVKDVQCGAKMFAGEGIVLLKETKENTWFADMEVLALSKCAGVEVEEVPVIWDEFHYTDRKSKLNVFRDGVQAIVAMKRIRRRMKNSEYGI